MRLQKALKGRLGPTGLIFKSKTVDFVTEKVDLRPERPRFRAVKINLSLGITEMKLKRLERANLKPKTYDFMVQKAY